MLCINGLFVFILKRSTFNVGTGNCKYESSSTSLAPALRLPTLCSSNTIPVSSCSQFERKSNSAYLVFLQL